MSRTTKCSFCGAQVKYKQTKCEYCGSEIIKQEKISDKKIFIEREIFIPSLSEKLLNLLKKSKSKINKKKINLKRIIKSIIIQPAYIAKKLNIKTETIQNNPTYKKIGLGLIIISASLVLPLLGFEIYHLSTYKSLLRETKILLENGDIVNAEKSIVLLTKTLKKTNFHKITLKNKKKSWVKNYLFDISNIYREIARIELSNNNFESNILNLKNAQKFYNDNAIRTDLIFGYYYLSKELFDDAKYRTAMRRAKDIHNLVFEFYYNPRLWNNFVNNFPGNINEFVADYNFLIGKSFSFLNNHEFAVFYFARAFRFKSNYTFENLNKYLKANQLKTIDDYCEDNTYFKTTYYEDWLEQTDYEVLCIKNSHYIDYSDDFNFSEIKKYRSMKWLPSKKIK